MNRTPLCHLQIEQSQVSQPFLISELHQVLSPCHSPLDSYLGDPCIFFNWGAQNWTQYSRCGLTRVEYRGRITCLSLLAMLFLMHPQDTIGLLGYKGTLLANGQPVVH